MVAELQLIFEKGGVMMIPLALCSFIVLVITIDRILMLRRGRLISDSCFESWRGWFSGDATSETPPGHCPSVLLNRLLAPLVDFFPLSASRLEERLGDLVRKEKHRLERGLVFLDTIAGIAPLFGLLGTALGMVEVFSKLSVEEGVKMASLSSGISQALFTTVTGLAIGIPALIATNLITRHIDNVLIATEDQLNQLVDLYPDRIKRS